MSEIMELRLRMGTTGIHTENNCTGTCVPCVRWHWHWQRAFNLIVVLSGHTRSHWVFFCVLCSEGVWHSCRAFCQNYDFMKLLFWFCKCFICICNCIWTFPLNPIVFADWMNVRDNIHQKLLTFSKWKMNEINVTLIFEQSHSRWWKFMEKYASIIIINVWYDVIMVIVYHCIISIGGVAGSRTAI